MSVKQKLGQETSIAEIDRVIQVETRRFEKRIAQILDATKFKNRYLIETILINTGCTAIHCEILPVEVKAQ